MMENAHTTAPQRTPVYAFDLDGTLTTRDTLLQFVRFCHPRWRFALGMLACLPRIVLMKCRLYSPDKAKEHMCRTFFRGWDRERLARYSRAFAQERGNALLRPEGVRTVRRLVDEGKKVYIVSASLDIWLRDLCRCILPEPSPHFTLVCTEAAFLHDEATGRDVCTGTFATPNCNRGEKVRRLAPFLTPRENYFLTAYGDSRGDHELYRYADRHVHRPFRP